jgi:hypothetical protein
MIHDNAAAKSHLSVIDRTITLLVAPAQDSLTEYTSKLLENLPALNSPSMFCKITSPITYDKLLAQHSIDPSTIDVALVFCGHGSDQSLDGPGTLPTAPDYKDVRLPFFNESHVRLGPKYLLAFCSNAATGLGRLYESHTTGRTFIGFDDEIGLVVEDGEYANSWGKIIHGIVLAMLSSPDILRLEKSVISLYDDALKYFSHERDREYEWGLLMRAYLRRQVESIKVIQT